MHFTLDFNQSTRNPDNGRCNRWDSLEACRSRLAMDFRRNLADHFRIKFSVVLFPCPLLSNFSLWDNSIQFFSTSHEHSQCRRATLPRASKIIDTIEWARWHAWLLWFESSLSHFRDSSNSQIFSPRIHVRSIHNSQKSPVLRLQLLFFETHGQYWSAIERWSEILLVTLMISLNKTRIFKHRGHVHALSFFFDAFSVWFRSRIRSKLTRKVCKCFAFGFILSLPLAIGFAITDAFSSKATSTLLRLKFLLEKGFAESDR